MQTARPWKTGNAAILYKDKGRKLVLALKHGDRHDIARPSAGWMSPHVEHLRDKSPLIAPVPLHWTRRIKRRYNQSALLARELASHTGFPHCPDLLKRYHRTEVLDGKSRDDRFETVSQAFEVPRQRAKRIAGRSVLLVDDVMTTGATLAACAEACLASHASEVHVITLARVAKDT